MKVELPVFGNKAREIAEHLELKMDGDYTDINEKVFVTYRSVEGHPKVVIELEI
jgi:hypothetical protein